MTTAALFYFGIWRDPFVQLSIELTRNPMFLTGFFGTVELPSTATPAEILPRYLRYVASKKGPYFPFEIERIGRVYVPEGLWGNLYSAALIDSPGGQGIVIFRHVRGQADVVNPKITEWWWAKIYPVP
jgi:hypothetical protein